MRHMGIATHRQVGQHSIRSERPRQSGEVKERNLKWHAWEWMSTLSRLPATI